MHYGMLQPIPMVILVVYGVTAIGRLKFRSLLYGPQGRGLGERVSGRAREAFIVSIRPSAFPAKS